jgi:ABC-type transport system involved in multi-copper enzyme maturation permease subunit
MSSQAVPSSLAPIIVDLGRAVRAEWTKFRTVRSSSWTLLTAAAVTVGVGVGFLPFIIDSYDGPTQQAAATAISEGWWFQGLQVSLLAVMILGVLNISSEYSTGTIRATLSAIPVRTSVVAAKTITFALVTLVVGAAQAVAVVLLARPVLVDRSIDVSLTDPAVWRGVTLTTLAVVGAGLFGLAAGMIIRHTAGAIGAVVAVTWVVSAFVHLLPASWENVIEALPASVMWAMSTNKADTLSGGSAAVVFYAYIAVLLTIAGILFARRDV